MQPELNLHLDLSQIIRRRIGDFFWWVFPPIYSHHFPIHFHTFFAATLDWSCSTFSLIPMIFFFSKEASTNEPQSLIFSEKWFQENEAKRHGNKRINGKRRDKGRLIRSKRAFHLKNDNGSKQFTKGSLTEIFSELPWLLIQASKYFFLSVLKT